MQNERNDSKLNAFGQLLPKLKENEFKLTRINMKMILLSAKALVAVICFTFGISQLSLEFKKCSFC